MKQAKTHQVRIQIHFRDADPAGFMYFANLFSYAHDAFESFVVHAGIPWKDWFVNNQHIVPIRHAEADYFAPLFPGEYFDVISHVESMSESTFKMHYQFWQGTKTHASVKMAHTFVNPKDMKKAKLPDDFRALLAPYLASPSKKEIGE